MTTDPYRSNASVRDTPPTFLSSFDGDPARLLPMEGGADRASHRTFRTTRAAHGEWTAPVVAYGTLTAIRVDRRVSVSPRSESAPAEACMFTASRYATTSRYSPSFIPPGSSSGIVLRMSA
jgi:hypothetical protein